jgi:hypothetical protein
VLRRNRLALSGGALVLVLVMVAIGSVYTFGFHLPFVGGVMVGVIGTTALAAVLWVADVAAGKHNDKFGTYGEEATADLFHRRRARRAGWQIVDQVAFDAAFGDVDHVAAGPAGVLAIESKWTNTPWRVADGDLRTPGRDPLQQARQGARKSRLLLRSYGVETTVVPVVIVWGPGALGDAGWAARWFGTVLVLRGARASEWFPRLEVITGRRASADLIRRVTEALTAYTEAFDRDAAQHAREPTRR